MLCWVRRAAGQTLTGHDSALEFRGLRAATVFVPTDRHTAPLEARLGVLWLSHLHDPSRGSAGRVWSTGGMIIWCCQQKLADSTARQLLGYHGRPVVDFSGPRRQRAAVRERTAAAGKGMVANSDSRPARPAPFRRDTNTRTIKSIVNSMLLASDTSFDLFFHFF